MYFQFKTAENGTNKIFREKQRTKKVPFMFLHVKVTTDS